MATVEPAATNGRDEVQTAIRLRKDVALADSEGSSGAGNGGATSKKRAADDHDVSVAQVSEKLFNMLQC